MRILIDLQAAQAESRSRGIGRYSLSLTRAMIQERGAHEIILLLNGLLPDSIESIRKQFANLLSPEQIVVWYAPTPIAYSQEGSAWKREAALQIRRSCIANVGPDVVLVMSWFEGYVDNALTALPRNEDEPPTCCVLYDLIPLLYPQDYLDSNPSFKEFYLDKVAQLNGLKCLLTISESAKQEALDCLDISVNKVVNISSAIDDCFVPVSVSSLQSRGLCARYGIYKPFVMYTGGMDVRKNVEGLIRAFASLPPLLRSSYQLVIVCKMVNADSQRLQQLAKSVGLAAEDLVLTGYVSEQDLLLLYNLCHLFVFPSRHEGFGLPVLEAMACGCAVICANASSLPEVIDCEEALFDPNELTSITQKLSQALSDPAFHARLKMHAREQAQQFSWKKSARRALLALEDCYVQTDDERDLVLSARPTSQRKPRLAFVSPLPPERSGISDYSAELLPELVSDYEVDVIVVQKQINDPWVNAHCAVYGPQHLLANADQYDRVLYHFGNSTFHDHMFSLLEQVPGVVVLHDFYLSGIVAHREVHGSVSGAWNRELYHSHGYRAVRERYLAKDTADIVWQYPCNLSVIQNAAGIIVHSEHARSLFLQWYGDQAAQDCSVIPLLRVPLENYQRDQARTNLGLSDDDFVVCSFGVLGKNKLNHRLLSAWASSALAQNPRCLLVFVGDYSSREHEQQIQKLISLTPNPGRIRVTGWTSPQDFKQYLVAADLAVQLRANSRGETSAAVLDCFNANLPTIINRHGSLADLPAQTCLALPDEFTDGELARALESLWGNLAARQELRTAAKIYLETVHAPKACAAEYVHAIEAAYAPGVFQMPRLIASLAAAIPAKNSIPAIDALANAVACTFPPKYANKQILVDISELVVRDSRSGIQRVVRSILQEWLINPPAGYRIEPVYASVSHGYRYARHFTLGFLNCPQTVLQDDPVEFYAGDHFVGLDLQPQVVPAQEKFYARLRRAGVSVKFLVYDLLPVLMPQYFVEGAKSGYQSWLEVVAQSDGVLCISKAVADQFLAWQKTHDQSQLHNATAQWFHLGADVQSSAPTTGISKSEQVMLKDLGKHPVFIMVGTIEPRKGYAQVLEAFEHLWQQGSNAQLVIVGKQGWMMEQWVDNVRSHLRLGKQLFWLEAISDEFLEALYGKSSCLIAASEGEGFGLPLIEAAMHHLPIIARDIPVFREVAGEHALYFSGGPLQLAKAIEQWLGLAAKNAQPHSEKMGWSTWKQSAQSLLELVLES